MQILFQGIVNADLTSRYYKMQNNKVKLKNSGAGMMAGTAVLMLITGLRAKRRVQPLRGWEIYSSCAVSLYRSAYRPFWARSSSWVPRSMIYPFSSTIMASAERTVESL